MTDTEQADAARLLQIYLQDHHAGSAAGLALVRRCRRANRGTPLGDVLARIDTQIADDRTALESMMARLGVSPNRLKTAVGSVAELVGRLKRNGRLTGYSPLSRVVELEGLAAGVLTKRNLWRALRAVADDHQGLDTEELDRLVERATGQLDQLLAVHKPAAVQALSPSGEGGGER